MLPRRTGENSTLPYFMNIFIVLLISALNPMMRDGTSGVLGPNFWKWNELIPFAIIIGIALCVGVYHLGKYYFTEWQPK